MFRSIRELVATGIFRCVDARFVAFRRHSRKKKDEIFSFKTVMTDERTNDRSRDAGSGSVQILPLWPGRDVL